MAANNAQFDVLLGGTQVLPPDFSVKRFAAARAQEIAALTQAIEDPQRTGLIFQKLPKHMRRRVMSRTSKRLPRKLRDAHMHQLRKSGLPPKHKRPSRKYRRRPQNLLHEYNRRQKNNVWLETHIWHAKRFHMTEKWGYKLADYPNDKSFRACYRATANHCLLQDISYNICIELKGPIVELLESLQNLTSKECGLTFGARAFLDGTREGSVMLFHQNTFPYGSIGRVTFLWKPKENIESEDEIRTIWIWVHPAFYEEVLVELKSLFKLNVVDNVENTVLDREIFPAEVFEMFSESSSSSDIEGTSGEITSSPAKKKCKLTEVNKQKKNVEEIKLATRNVPFIRTPKYLSHSGNVQMILLKDTLNRFRLTGPLSHAVLLQSLCISNILGDISRKCEPESKEDNNSIDLDISDKPNVSADNSKEGEYEKWWKVFYGASSEQKETWLYQETLWKMLKGASSPAQLPSHLVLALTIQDPRLQLPLKRTKAVPNEKDLWKQESEEQILSVSSSACVSPIWNPHIRDLATKSKMSSAELAEIRSHNLVPGFVQEEFDFGTAESSSNTNQDGSHAKSCIPILLIQRPGSQNPETKRLGFGSGWDVVIPTGWAVPLWMALMFRGARAGGLRESGSLEFESCTESLFPPDTVSGSAEEEVQRIKLVERHFRLPPKKRPNYVKLGIASPFNSSWKILIDDWSRTTSENVVSDICNTEDSTSSLNNEVFVLRETKKLEGLKTALNNFRKKNVPNISNFADLFPTSTTSCLIPVRVKLYGKGCPANHALICLPSEVDVDNISKNTRYSGPKEDLHVDEHQTERKELRTEHKKLLKQLRRKRVRERQKCENNVALESDSGGESEQNNSKHISLFAKRKASDPPPTKDIIDKHEEVMRSLWLPNTKTIKESCSRTVIGFVTKGDFSFTESHGFGQGYVVLPAFLQMVAWYGRRMNEKSRVLLPWVLVRNPTSLQYRFGVIHIQGTK